MPQKKLKLISKMRALEVFEFVSSHSLKNSGFYLKTASVNNKAVHLGDGRTIKFNKTTDHGISITAEFNRC